MKKNYLIPAICGLFCIVIIIILWYVYLSSVEDVAASQQGSEGVGIALATVILSFPFMIVHGSLAAFIFILSGISLIFMAIQKVSPAVVRILGIFEIILAMSFAFILIMVSSVALWLIISAVALVMSVIFSVISFVSAHGLSLWKNQ